MGLNQMIAMDGGRYRRIITPGLHELKHRHLCSGILHGNPVGMELQITGSGLEFLTGRVDKVTQENFLRVGHGAAQTATNHLEIGLDLLIARLDKAGGRFNLGHGYSSATARLPVPGNRSEFCE